MPPPHHGATIYSRRDPANKNGESSPPGMDPINGYVPVGDDERGKVVVPSGSKSARRLNGWQRLWIVLTILGWFVSAIMLLADGGGRGLSPSDYWLGLLAALAFITVAVAIVAGLFYVAGLVIAWVWRGFRSE